MQHQSFAAEDAADTVAEANEGNGTKMDRAFGITGRTRASKKIRSSLPFRISAAMSSKLMYRLPDVS